MKRECPDCGKVGQVYATSNKRALFHCRDTREGLGCGYRGTSGVTYSAKYLDVIEAEKAAQDAPANEGQAANDGDDNQASTGRGKRKRADAGSADSGRTGIGLL